MSISVEAVKANLASADYGDRLQGVNQLRQLDPAVAFELLVIATADANPRVRYAAVSQMSSLGTQDLNRSLDLLRNCLRTDSESDVRAAAADAVGGLKLQEVFPDLQELYHNSTDWILRLSIVAALGELGATQAFDILAEALTASDDLLKLAAIGSLGELGDLRAVALLIPFVDDPDWQVRHRVAIALQHLGGEQAQPLLALLAKDSMDQVAAAATQPI